MRRPVVSTPSTARRRLDLSTPKKEDDDDEEDSPSYSWEEFHPRSMEAEEGIRSLQRMLNIDRKKKKKTRKNKGEEEEEKLN